MKRQFREEKRLTATLGWTGVALGSVLRFRLWAANQSLWLDEAALALNVIERSGRELLKPLALDQAAPYGFLLLEKAGVAFWGAGEQALRLLPFVFSLIALVAFYKLARMLLSKYTAAFAVWLFAVSPTLVTYAVELKPYSLDVAASTGLLLLALWAWRQPSRQIVLAFVGAVAVWFSYPSIFVLVGVFGVVVLHAVVVDEDNQLVRWLPAHTLWIVSFGLYYLISLRDAAGNDYLHQYWASGFAPVNLSMETVNWYLSKSWEIFDKVVGLEFLPGLGLLTALLGAAAMVSRASDRLLLLTAPILVTLGASAVGSWPFEGRLILFLAPMLIIFIGAGVQWILAPKSARNMLLGGTLLVLILLIPAKESLGNFISPPSGPEARSVLEGVFSQRRPSEAVYIHYILYPTYRYYAHRRGWPVGSADLPSDLFGKSGSLKRESGSVIIGERASQQWSQFYRDIQSIRTHSDRVWFVFTYVHGAAGIRFYRWLMDHLGQQCRQISRDRAEAHLYWFPSEQSEAVSGASCRE